MLLFNCEGLIPFSFSDLLYCFYGNTQIKADKDIDGSGPDFVRKEVKNEIRTD